MNDWKNLKKKRKKNYFHIRWQLLSVILPVAIIPLILIVGFTTNRIFMHLEENSRDFYSSILNQIANNIDFIYDQYGRTLTNIVKIPSVQMGLAYPPYKTLAEELEISDLVKGKNTIYEGGRVISEGLRKTVEEKIDGDVSLYELDRVSLVNNTDYMLHKLNTAIPDPNIDKLLQDPLYQIVKKDNSIKFIFGKFQDGVLKGVGCENKPVMIFPYYKVPPENPEDTFTKFILIQLFPDFIQKFYYSIRHIKYGTMYILDQFDNIIEQNHPSVSNDYYEFDFEKNKYILGDDDPDDPYEKMSFKDYKLLNINPEILTLPYVKEITNTLNTEGYDIELEKDETENVFNKKHIIKYNNIEYMMIVEFCKSSKSKLVYFHPMYQIHKPVYSVINVIIYITLIVIVIIVFVSIIYSKIFTEPIKNLVKSAGRISQGDYKHILNTDNFHGEFFLLGSSFNEMAMKIDDYSENLEEMVRQRTAEIKKANEKMKNELVMAQNIQQAIIPKVFPKVSILQIFGFYQPMDDLGGDFYDVFMINKTKVVFLIVDVCGHGVSAALITTMAKVSFFNNSKDNLSTSEIVGLVNEEICNVIGENNSYFTAFYAIFDIESKILEYTNAGHNEIVILRKDKTLSILESNSMFVGMMKRLVYNSAKIKLDTDDRIILYTDGIPEVRNSDKELFGFERFKQLILNYAELSLEKMIDNIIRDVKEYRGDFRVDDDMTILVIHILSDRIDININLSEIVSKIKSDIESTGDNEYSNYKKNMLQAIDLFNSSNYNKSIEVLSPLEKVFNRKNDKFDVLYLLGCNYYKNSNYQTALVYFEQAIDINSNNPSLLNMINILKEK